MRFNLLKRPYKNAGEFGRICIELAAQFNCGGCMAKSPNKRQSLMVLQKPRVGR